MRTAFVALLSPPFAVLTYSLPDYLPAAGWFEGQRVAVPLGNSLRVGVILHMDAAGTAEETGIMESRRIPASNKSASPVCTVAGAGAPRVVGADSPLPGEFAGGADIGSVRAVPQAPQKQAMSPAAQSFQLKEIFWPLERTPLLSRQYLDLALQLARRQTAGPGRILANLLPAGLRTTQARIRFFGEGKPREVKVRALASLPRPERLRLAHLWSEGRAEVCRADVQAADAEVCRLAADPPWPVRPAAKAQTTLLDYLFEHGDVTRRALQEALGPQSAAVLATLVKRGLVQVLPVESMHNENETSIRAGVSDSADTSIIQKTFFSLTPDQQAIFAPLRENLLRRTGGAHLLFGVTGSGKTAVYLELARETLRQGRSVLLLAPEVALALKLRRDAAEALPEARRLLFHGYLGLGEKERIFRCAAENREPLLVVGTRSALFLPVENIGLIVLDEEHDSSFKQDEGFTYQAKEVAWYRAGREKALLLLGSATPDVKSYHAAREGRLGLHVLTERVGGALPEIQLVRLPKGRIESGLLAEESLTALRDVVERGEQAVILLNRRGYAPLMYCLSCGTTAKCPHCDIGLAYHKGRERLLCHYCGWSTPFPSPCAVCKGMHFLPMGEGTEKIEESLAPVLPPGAGVLRLDRDSTRRPGRMEEILDAFARKEASVLVGTQMLSKGHHFPDVTLAVIADADLGLNLPDYRAAERTFQLLVQSAGRSGRGDRPGFVLVQTRDPAHYCWEFVRNGDYVGFFEREVALRKRRLYPPFVHLALIRISYPVTAPEAREEAAALGPVLKEAGREQGVTVLGPAPAPLAVLKGRRRFHCLLKGDDWQALRRVYAVAVAQTRQGRLRVALDLDPVNML